MTITSETRCDYRLRKTLRDSFPGNCNRPNVSPDIDTWFVDGSTRQTE